MRENTRKIMVSDVFDKCISSMPKMMIESRSLGLFLSKESYNRHLEETGKKKAKKYKGFKIIVCNIQSDRILFSDAD